MKPLLRWPSPSMVVALMALFVALGGTGYAALTITGKNVKDASLTGRDIKNNSVRSADVAGLRATDFTAGQLPAGSQGPPGPQGAQGAQGSQGAQGQKGDPGQAGTAGTARAYALVQGDGCSGSPFLACPVLRGKGVAYVIRVGTGLYCIGVTGIDAAAPDSVAIVAVPRAGGSTLYHARWHSNNAACVSSEFEVETSIQFEIGARNVTDTGSVAVASPNTASSQRFTIAIL